MSRLGSEAGFFELDPGFVGSTTQSRARMFYAFQPADSAPETKPLLLFFQGGPFASMLPLWGGNTARRTLDPARTNGSAIAPNPHSWSRFANLLYVDSPYAGFSYIVGGDVTQFRNPEKLSWEEAAAFTQVLMRFLARHPQLARNRVVLVGESYGGARAVMMLSQLLRYMALPQPRLSFDGAKLAREIDAQIAVARGVGSRGGFSPAEVGERLGHILIQPSVADWPIQPPKPSDAARQRSLDAHTRFQAMGSAILQPVVFDQHAGVVGQSIQWMYATERRAQGINGPHIRPFHTHLPDEAAFARVFGALQDQVYLRPLLSLIVPNTWTDTYEPFGTALRHVPTFITNAGLDDVVDVDQIIDYLPVNVPGIAAVQRRQVNSHVQQVEIRFTDGASRTLHAPRYPNSGHTVSMFEPAQLAEDVQQWLALLPR